MRVVPVLPVGAAGMMSLMPRLLKLEVLSQGCWWQGQRARRKKELQGCTLKKQGKAPRKLQGTLFLLSTGSLSTC